LGQYRNSLEMKRLVEPKWSVGSAQEPFRLHRLYIAPASASLRYCEFTKLITLVAVGDGLQRERNEIGILYKTIQRSAWHCLGNNYGRQERDDLQLASTQAIRLRAVERGVKVLVERFPSFCLQRHHNPHVAVRSTYDDSTLGKTVLDMCATYACL
jgi:hypothetical protein